MTPGTHPQSHNKNTIIIEPQPLSKTANGGHKIDKITLIKLIYILNYKDN
ncbi:uncharacterized protein METZ01_LOCUS54573 [marine metagenome]|mgnify:FL=1|uniref:Uncharacterized protein n=1 Tax=marine metagenome TaxID=408172 RepID=A0A381SDY7_9ZZZZ